MTIKSTQRGGQAEVATTRYALGSSAYGNLQGQAPAFTGRGEVSVRNKAFDAQTRGDLATYNSLMGQLK